MRILFVHASWSATPEYSTHWLLAEHADPADFECYFIWQDSLFHRDLVSRSRFPDHHFFYDFGRDMDSAPHLPKARRAALMLSRLPGGVATIAAKLRALKPDVIYTAQQAYDLRLVGAVNRLFRLPHLIHVHYPVGLWLGKNAFQTIRATPHLIASSDFVRTSAVAAGVAEEHIRTVYNAVNVARFDIARDAGTGRALFGLPPTTPVVVAAGRLDPTKNHALLIAAFARVHQVLPEARLLICGAPSPEHDGHAAQLRQTVTDLGLAEVITFAGPRRDLPVIFAAADLFCLPTLNEAFGLVFGEAMVAGLPVVACRSGAVGEVVVDGQTGLLSEPDDAPALAANMVRLLRDPALAAQMGAAGRARAFATFTPDATAQQWAKVLRRYFPASFARTEVAIYSGLQAK